MAAIEDRIQAIEDEIANTKKNKATESHLGRLKAKLAKLRIEKEKRAEKGGGGAGGYAVAKSGHATVALVGLPSVGKSTLLNALTGAKSETAAYEFTTLDVVPGIVKHQGAEIQILDLPGLIGGASSGRGRGREVLSVVRGADLILLTVDVFRPRSVEVLERELYDSAIRLNGRRPDVKVRPLDRGGINVRSTVELSHVDEDQVANILREFSIPNADVVIRDDVTAEEFIDAVAENRVYTPAMVALTKVDMVDDDRAARAVQTLEADGWRVVPVSGTEMEGLEPLKQAVYDELDLIRVYLKPQGQEADMEEPLVIRRGSTVADICRKLHRDFADKFRYAVVTGPSSKFPEQTVGLDHTVEDTDVLTIIVKR